MHREVPSLATTAFMMRVKLPSPAPDVYAMTASLTLPCIKSLMSSFEKARGLFRREMLGVDLVVVRNPVMTALENSPVTITENISYMQINRRRLNEVASAVPANRYREDP